MAVKNFTLACLLSMLAACGGGGSEVAAPAQPAGSNAIKVATYGDSTQAEQGNPHAAQRPGYTIENRGVGSSNSSDLMSRWSAQLVLPNSIVVINHGINDRNLIQYRANLRAMVEQAQAAKKIVMLEMPNPSGETMTPLMVAIGFDIAAFNERRDAMRQVAQSMGVYLCDQPRVALRDGIHPTPEGYAVKAQRLAACLQDVI